MGPESESLESRRSFAHSPPLRDYFRQFGGTERPGLRLKLLPFSEATRLIDNWPRYGFSPDRGYVPIAEDQNGDLYCLACTGDGAGQVFHLAWDGEEHVRFASLNAFVETLNSGPLTY